MSKVERVFEDITNRVNAKVIATQGQKIDAVWFKKLRHEMHVEISSALFGRGIIISPDAIAWLVGQHYMAVTVNDQPMHELVIMNEVEITELPQVDVYILSKIYDGSKTKIETALKGAKVALKHIKEKTSN